MIPEFIVLHHTADPSKEPQFNKVNAYHKGKGFPKSSLGYYVGYHYFIGQDGTVKQAKKEQEIGSHVVNCGCSTDQSGKKEGTLNNSAIGICLAGDFKSVPLNQLKLGEEGQPTEMQIKSLTALIQDIQSRRNIPDTKILLHGETKFTSCPGVNLRELVFLERVNQMKERLKSANVAVLKPYLNITRKNMLLRLIERLKNTLGMS